MAEVTTREELKDYCLRKLGVPIIEINVSDEQVDDRITEGFQKYIEYHYDAVELTYLKHTITQEDVDNKYLIVDDRVVSIIRMFPLSTTVTNSYMWDIRYQIRLNELWDFTSVNLLYYTTTMQHLRNLELTLVGEVPIRFQRHTNKLFLDLIWGSTELPVGSTVMLEGYVSIDPDIYPKIYNDLWLKNYCTVLIKRQWGSNLQKFQGIQLPGGLTLNGDSIYTEATREIEKMEAELQDKFEIPIQFFLG